MSFRILGGTYKGKVLKAPKGKQTRPITSALRKSLFDSCQFFISDKVVLDLFAGSGSIGIEALSRGAKFAYFNDLSREAISCIENNLHALNLGEKANVTRQDAFSLLPNKWMEPIDIGFLHPPYPIGSAGYEKLIETLGQVRSSFSADAHLYLETPADLTELCEELLMKDFDIIKVKQSSTTGLIHFCMKSPEEKLD